MSNLSEAQRIAAVRKLTAELYQLQDRMNQTVDQITGLLHGTDLGSLLPGLAAPRAEAEGTLERRFVPAALTLPLPAVYMNNPASGTAVGVDAKLYSDFKSGQLQLVQVPGGRGSDARHALVLNFAGLNASYLSLVFDALPLLAGLPAGRMRVALALETRNDYAAKLHAKFAFKVAGHWGENVVEPQGGRIQVASFELPLVDPSGVEALDFHVIFSPPARGCIELHRLAITVTLVPVAAGAAEAAVAGSVFEGEA